jgi:hypothetical protein
MIRAKQPLHPRLRQNRAQQLGGDVAFQQALAVLGKRRVIPRRIVDASADEPAKQEVELEPIHQRRSERIESNACKSIARKSFSGGIDGRPIGEYSVENSGQSREGLVHDRADRPQQMILPNLSLKIDVAEQSPRPFVLASHDSVPAPRCRNRITTRFQ